MPHYVFSITMITFVASWHSCCSRMLVLPCSSLPLFFFVVYSPLHTSSCHCSFLAYAISFPWSSFLHIILVSCVFVFLMVLSHLLFPCFSVPSPLISVVSLTLLRFYIFVRLGNFLTLYTSLFDRHLLLLTVIAHWCYMFNVIKTCILIGHLVWCQNKSFFLLATFAHVIRQWLCLPIFGV